MDNTAATASLPAILFWGILTFSLIVIVHEAGHFLSARLFGVRVHEFMLGLPGPAIRLKTKNTAFGVTMVPFGGYVKIAGMEPGEEDPLLGKALALAAANGGTDVSTLANSLDVGIGRARSLLTTLTDWGALAPDEGEHSYSLVEAVISAARPGEDLLSEVRRGTYRGKKTWQRIVILGMGVFLNLALAILTFSVVLSTWGYYEPSTTVDAVVAGSAADQAGIEAGDAIVAVEGEPVATWDELLGYITESEAGDTLSLEVERGEEALALSATLGERAGGPFLGVETRFVNVRLGPIEAVTESVRWTGMVFVALGNLFRPDRFAAQIDSARGLVGVSVEAAQAAQRGPIDYAWMLALLSLSLGAINVFPIPPLDGGKIVLELVERAIGRPIPRNVYLGMSVVGALLIFSLIFYLVYADLVRYVFS